MAGSKTSREVFGKLADGDSVEAVTLTNAAGMSVKIISYGASIQSVCIPDVRGYVADVTPGYTTLDEYVAQPQFFGSTVGRVANRIAHARFTLDGTEYHVPANDGVNSLHGGEVGFDKVNWIVTDCDEDALSVTLLYISPDGDQGYPGNLSVTATYRLSEDNAVSVHYRATTDAPTCVNLSNHAYWNLGGEGSAYDAMDHLLMIPAERFLPVDSALIPTGERRNVAGTAFDFRTPTPIKNHVRDVADEQLRHGRGFDHNWVIDEAVAPAPRLLALLEDPHSGRTMTLYSNQPGLQFYSGNFFDGSTAGKAGKSYRMGDAIALEPQMFPDAPNQPAFPSVTLLPGEVYENSIIWRFGTTKEELA
ncbi:aldose epimerase family protein [Sphingorhabdus sp.]|uniref:aldose epimerase family protein n=1 Tax=Sphingorhabdus sp. TaxID=1902408 RepID=UPI003982F4D6